MYCVLIYCVSEILQHKKHATLNTIKNTQIWFIKINLTLNKKKKSKIIDNIKKHKNFNMQLNISKVYVFIENLKKKENLVFFMKPHIAA